MVAALREMKILTVPAGENTIRFLPPLIISEDEIRLAVESFDTALIKMGLSKMGLSKMAPQQDSQ
jgi:acetylornithine/N-succinyldiaminopimelate aminotransferase